MAAWISGRCSTTRPWSSALGSPHTATSTLQSFVATRPTAFPGYLESGRRRPARSSPPTAESTDSSVQSRRGRLPSRSRPVSPDSSTSIATSSDGCALWHRHAPMPRSAPPISGRVRSVPRRWQGSRRHGGLAGSSTRRLRRSSLCERLSRRVRLSLCGRLRRSTSRRRPRGSAGQRPRAHDCAAVIRRVLPVRPDREGR